MKGNDAEIETNKDKVPLNFDDVDLNSWVLVLYEGEKLLGRILTKAAGKFEVQCLQKP